MLCLYDNIPLYWGIKSNKNKDDVDFYAKAVRIRPTTTDRKLYNGPPSGSYGNNPYWDSGNPLGYGKAYNLTFRGGPFIIDSPYASKALTTLDTM